MVPAWFLYFMYVLIVSACALLIPSEIVMASRTIVTWVVMLFHRPRQALMLLWARFWGSWEPTSFLAGVLIAFIFDPPLLGYGTTKALFVLAMVLIFVRLCLAETLHGEKSSRRDTSMRIWVMIFVAVGLGSISFVMCGALENASRGKVPTWGGIWQESLWWRPASTQGVPSTPQQATKPQEPGIAFKRVPFEEVAPNAMFLAPLPDSFFVDVGGNVSAWSKSELTKEANNATGIEMGDGLPMSIYLSDDGQVTMDLSLYDVNGQLAAQITDSKVAISPKFPSWQINEDSIAIEIVNQHTAPVLQIERLRGDTLKIRGVFRVPDTTASNPRRGMVVIANDDGMLNCAAPRVHETLDKRCIEKMAQMKKLFKYPAVLHPHERLD